MPSGLDRARSPSPTPTLRAGPVHPSQHRLERLRLTGPRYPGTFVPYRWHTCGMARVRVSTTVDEDLLAKARGARGGVGDAVLIDEALAALVAQHRAVELDGAYAAYDEHPLDETDEWGDLASFREAAAAS